VWYHGEGANDTTYTYRNGGPGATGDIDSINLWGLTYYSYIKPIADIDNGKGNGVYTGMVITWKTVATFNPFSFHIISFGPDSALASAVHSLDSLQDLAGWVAQQTTVAEVPDIADTLENLEAWVAQQTTVAEVPDIADTLENLEAWVAQQSTVAEVPDIADTLENLEAWVAQEASLFDPTTDSVIIDVSSNVVYADTVANRVLEDSSSYQGTAGSLTAEDIWQYDISAFQSTDSADMAGHFLSTGGDTSLFASTDDIWEYDTSNVSGSAAFGTMLKDTSAYQGAASGITVDQIWEYDSASVSGAAAMGTIIKDATDNVIAYLDEAISGIDDNPWDAVTRTLTDTANLSGLTIDIPDGEITAAKIATNALTSDELDASFSVELLETDTSGIDAGFGQMLKDTSAYQGSASGLTVEEITHGVWGHTADSAWAAGSFGDSAKGWGATSASSLDSGIVSRIAHRVVWGTAQGSGDDSSTSAQRDIGAVNANAINAAAIATDAFTSDELASSFSVELLETDTSGIDAGFAQMLKDTSAYQGSGADASPSNWDATDSLYVYKIVGQAMADSLASITMDSVRDAMGDTARVVAGDSSNVNVRSVSDDAINLVSDVTGALPDSNIATIDVNPVRLRMRS